MFTHCETDYSEDGSEGSNESVDQKQFCATTKTTRDIQIDTLKGHLKELAKFSEAELIAAIDDQTDDGSEVHESNYKGDVMSVDGDYESEEE